jgi:hypothetical protein
MTAAEPAVGPGKGAPDQTLLSIGKKERKNTFHFSLNGRQVARVHGGEHVCTMSHWPQIEILFCSARMPEQSSIHLQE